jgi:hypothetical protein
MLTKSVRNLTDKDQDLRREISDDSGRRQLAASKHSRRKKNLNALYEETVERVQSELMTIQDRSCK